MRCSKCLLTLGSVVRKSKSKSNWCELCETYSPIQRYGEEGLKEKVSTILERFPNRSYDCIVPISGGRDSAYVLYYMHSLGYKILAVNFDNEFMTDNARENIFNMTRKLGVPLITERAKKTSLAKLVKCAVRLWGKLPPDVVFGLVCGGCGYSFKRFVLKVAKEEKVPIVVWGDSKEESTKNIVPDRKPHLSFWQKINPLIFYWRAHYKVEFMKLQKEFPDLTCEIHEIHLFDYIDWNPEEFLEIIQRELNWYVPEDAPTTWRQDCMVSPFADYLMKQAYGVSKLELGFSNMLRAGKMRKEDAIEQINAVEKMRDAKIKKLFDRLSKI